VPGFVEEALTVGMAEIEQAFGGDGAPD